MSAGNGKTMVEGNDAGIFGPQKPLTGWEKVWLPRFLTAIFTVYFIGLWVGLLGLSQYVLQQLGVLR